MDTQPAANPTEGSDLGAEIDRLAVMLRSFSPAGSEIESLDRITAFEELKGALAAAQAREAVNFASKRMSRDLRNRVPVRKRGLRVGDEIGLAKKVSPASGRAFLRTAKALTTALPDTFAALSRGVISEDKARVVVDETEGLPDRDRTRVDTRISESLPSAGMRSLRSEARALAIELSGNDADERVKKATAGRRVTLTPLRDGMGRLTAKVPIQQAVAAFEGLKACVESTVAGGQSENRSPNQIMADTLVVRLTGQKSAEAVPTQLHVLIDANSLFSDGKVPAWIPGMGPVPSKTTRNFVAANNADVFIRRMFTAAKNGQLVATETRGRKFTGNLRRMVVFRDDVCRTPWCDAPIKHVDHVNAHADGGATTWENGSGLCASCNFAKEHPGWKHEVSAHGLTVTTPSGKTYTDVTPPLLKRMRHRRWGPNPPDWKKIFSKKVSEPISRYSNFDFGVPNDYGPCAPGPDPDDDPLIGTAKEWPPDRDVVSMEEKLASFGPPRRMATASDEEVAEMMRKLYPLSDDDDDDDGGDSGQDTS